MSNIGTSVAAGGAQTALQAQQTARGSDRDRAAAARNSDRTREIFEAKLQNHEEAADSDSVQLDDQMPDHQAPGYEMLDRNPSDEAEADEANAESEAAPPADGATPSPPPPPEGGLYRHLDIKV